MSLSDEVKEIWNANAEFWDSKMSDGNRFHKILIEPSQLRLLELQKGQKVLDIACGNGQFSRKLYELGCEVTAIDISDKFIELNKNNKYGNDIDYRVIDVTKEAELELLTEKYDSAVCSMAFMDIEDIEPIFKSLKTLLKKHGKFVFSLCHPCFNSGDMKKIREAEEIGDLVRDKYWISTSGYSESKSYKGLGMDGQPKLHYYFHRTISETLSAGFKNGFVLDGIEEPTFEGYADKNNFFLMTYEKTPPALICRMRLI